MRFLIVDDSLPMRRIMTNVLGRLGHRDVIETANGREALDQLDAGPVDFVILVRTDSDGDGTRIILD